MLPELKSMVRYTTTALTPMDAYVNTVSYELCFPKIYTRTFYVSLYFVNKQIKYLKRYYRSKI